MASQQFERRAETGQDPYAEDHFLYRYDIHGSVKTIGEALQYFVDAYDAKDLLPKPKHENFPLQYLFPTQ